MHRERSAESGFSLTELMVALVVTLLVSGAIFGLLSSGQSAFRREPELSDRQQNIRAAVAMIQRDIQVAGMEMPPFIQAFTDNLNNVSNGARSGSGRPDNAPSVMQANNEMADELELWGNDGLCPTLTACGNWSGVSGVTQEALPTCYSFPALILLSDGVRQEVRWGCKPGQGANQSCAGNNPNGHVVFPPGQSVLNPPGGSFPPTLVSVVQRVRYEIRMDAQGVPNLFRSGNGGLTPPTQGQCNNDGGINGDGMQLVARGIEDMQVWYQNGADVAANTWRQTPGTVTCATCSLDPPVLSGSADDWNTIIRRVRVTLSGRAVMSGVPVEGQTRPQQGTAPTAIRGRLTIEVVPRAALFHLSETVPNPPGPQWR